MMHLPVTNIVIVTSSFNGLLEKSLLQNCLSTFGFAESNCKDDEIDDIINQMFEQKYFIQQFNIGMDVFNTAVIVVPGAMEIPQAIKWITKEHKQIHGIITLGCVIQGKTSHYNHVCEQSISNIQLCALETGIPTITSIVTANNKEDAVTRCSSGKKNTGLYGMKSLLHIIKLKHTILEQSHKIY